MIYINKHSYYTKHQTINNLITDKYTDECKYYFSNSDKYELMPNSLEKALNEIQNKDFQKVETYKDLQLCYLYKIYPHKRIHKPTNIEISPHKLLIDGLISDVRAVVDYYYEIGYYATARYILYHNLKNVSHSVDMYYNPQNTSEIIYKNIVLNSFIFDNIKSKLTDKVYLKEFVKANFGDEYNVPTLGIFDNIADALKFANNAGNCVIKRNDDSGSITKFINGKADKSIQKLITIYNYPGGYFGKITIEPHYKLIERKILVEPIEKYCDYDFKFMVINKSVKYFWITVDQHRTTNGRVYYGIDLNKLPLCGKTYESTDDIIKRVPAYKNICSKMLSFCEEIINKLPINDYRIDLYYDENNEQIKISELTFSSDNGMTNIF